MAKNSSVQEAVGDCMLPLLGMFCCVLFKYSTPASRFSEHPHVTEAIMRQVEGVGVAQTAWFGFDLTFGTVDNLKNPP
ncbi:hypothetical protein B9Z45_00925 [Limnohabitans sp. 2KL-17]|uniref:hypothetical protein n=1 Tax=Limnohabitans sp. 2KL-17 TaxID=1100704 RepID=UPI000D36E9C6|nr:hypothetical protein [Limnohabitans sp. 2KL-17]PUE63267.1 hypothetical protein B9Z45_00925 [Limnohabitans sp. 2KL-17]